MASSPALEHHFEKNLMRKGIKRKSTLLEDKTNFAKQGEVMKKKRNHDVSVEDTEIIAEVQARAVMPVQGQVEISTNLDAEQETQRSSPNVIFPCDVVRSQRDGHLFSTGYILSMRKSMDSNEKDSTDCFPCPNYFQTQKDLRPRMRTILFTWITEVHMKFEFREVVL